MATASSVILNVDDYAPGRYARTKLLTLAGFTVLEAATGKEALEIVRRDKPDVVLLDINLPDMSGFEVCRIIRKDRVTAPTTVIHISASNIQAEHQVHGLDLGANTYLVEPIDSSVLIATVKAFLRARQAEEALRRSNEDLERFAYTVAHDLNEPLRTVTAHTQLLARQIGAGNTDPASLAECMRFIVEGAQRMRGLIDDILRYSQATHVGVDVRPLDGEELFANVVASLGEAIRDSGVVITHDRLPVLFADPRIQHVFQNLISNAIKYRREDVPLQVHVSARTDGSNLEVSVRDNGIGIEPQFKESIFHIFRRLHGREVPGTGIGLAVSQKIIDAHGGRIWVDSTPGVGSTFYFTLPQDRPV